jgi:competence protein ComEC
VRAVAAVPAIGLIAGSAISCLVPDLPPRVALFLLIVLLTAAILAWRASWVPALGITVGCAFLVGAAMLSASAWRQAWRPSLRVAFEQLARQQRAEGVREGRLVPEDDEAFAVVEGTLRSDAAPTLNGISISLDVGAIEVSRAVDSLQSGADPDSARMRTFGRAGPRTWLPVSGGVQATVVGFLGVDRLGEWRAGRRVRMPIQLHRPSRYLNPEVPDFERALARRGTTLVGTVKSGALVELIARGNRVDEVTASVRAYARRAIAQAVGSRSTESAAIVSAIVIGDRAGLDDEVQRRLQEAGTYHVIAISGGNIAILAGLLLGMFRMAGMFGRAAMVSAIGVLITYARLVGGGASVDRATLMAVVYFAARAIDQRSPPLNALSLVAACLIVTQPLSVLDPAFVLTFGATLAILVAAPVVRTWDVPRRVTPVVGLFAASIATEVMLAPVGALVFSRVTFAGLALNFAAIPSMAIAQIAGMALVPAALVSRHATAALGFVAHLAATGLIRSADLVRFVPMLTFRLAPPAAWAVAAYYIAIALLYVVWPHPRVRWTALAVALCAAIWIVAEPWAILAAWGDDRLRLTFIDVGQGDAALVRFPRGTAMVVDTGGLGGSSSFDVGDRVVAPVLRASGVRRLAFLVLTHGDPDHIGGAASLIREFRPREVWEGIPVPRFEPLSALRAEAHAVHANWANLKTGDRVVVDGVDVIVRHPGIPDWERQRVRNDDSIVLELVWRDVSVLLTGDIGKAVERAMVSEIPPAPVRIVKIAHHGSLTSSTPELVRALAPRIAIVSAGRANHFGHPVPEVLARYRQEGAEIFRTDQDGAVTIDTDGKTVDVRTFTGRHVEFSSTAIHREVTKDTKP